MEEVQLSVSFGLILTITGRQNIFFSDGALHSLFEYLIFAENVPIWGIFESITYVMASKGRWKTTSLGKDWKIYILQLKDCMRKKNAKGKAPFGLSMLKFNSHHINVPSNTWSTKCRLIACMSAQIRSNLRDESIKPN
jgi:hypothetical protein